MRKLWLVGSVCLLATFLYSKALAEQLTIAVASNFYGPLSSLKSDLETHCKLDTQLISGASGVLYQQAKHGAPFDVLLFANQSYAQELAQNSKQPAFSYAQGELVFVGKIPFKRAQSIAIANPKLAPYGQAASEYLTAMGFTGRQIQANNVAQAFSFSQMGTVDGALVAKSLALDGQSIPSKDYTAIIQQGIVLTDSAAGQCVQGWLTSKKVQLELSQMGFIALGEAK